MATLLKHYVEVGCHHFNYNSLTGRELDIEIEAYLTSSAVQRTNVSVEINDKIVISHIISVADISLQLGNLGDDIQVANTLLRYKS